MDNKVRVPPSPTAYNAHAGPWAVLGAVARPDVEQENGPRQRALKGSPWVVRTLTTYEALRSMLRWEQRRLE